MRHLLGMVHPGNGRSVVLDVLGGDGTVARAAATAHAPELDGLQILTSDSSGHMIECALDSGLPAIRQDAGHLFLVDGCVDGVFMAYGSHHIPPEHRQRVLKELVRVVRPGGRVLVHDFEETGAMARFFGEVVAVHAKAGHDYQHFTRDGLRSIFRGAGLEPRLSDVYDPLIAWGPTRSTAQSAMCDYIGAMYGVSGFLESMSQSERWALICAVFDHSKRALPADATACPVVRPGRRGFLAEGPRVALVAVGQR
jgi:SAM-dependent methyltransferase